MTKDDMTQGLPEEPEPEPAPEPKEGNAEEDVLVSITEELIQDLKIIIIRTSFKKYYASYVKSDTLPEGWPNDIGLEDIIQSEKGILDLSGLNLEFLNNKDNPFGIYSDSGPESRKLLFQNLALEMVQEKGIISRKELYEEILKIDPNYPKGTFDGNINNTSRGNETPRLGFDATPPFNLIQNTKYKITDNPQRDYAAICHSELEPAFTKNDEFRDNEFDYTEQEWRDRNFSPKAPVTINLKHIMKKITSETPMPNLEYIEQIFFKDITKLGDFLQGRYSLRKPEGGGGQTYFDVAGQFENYPDGPTLHDFFDYAEIIGFPRDGEDRPTYQINAYSLGGGDIAKQIEFAPRTANRYKISRTNIDLHPAWTAANGFPSLPLDFLETGSKAYGNNTLLYGVPGSGKSWTIQNIYLSGNEGPKADVVERVVFHPDYTYSDFVGQILPSVSEGGEVGYRFEPGPFTKILAEATKNPGAAYYLIIEELNRGNTPAIFGDIFQLLDRKEGIAPEDDGRPLGCSEYTITNSNIARVVYGNDTQKIMLPPNLWILATMNTSDQNVFTLDTAFQRRWKMRMIDNKFEATHRFADSEILDTGVTWKNFCTGINELIVGSSIGMSSSEDKRLGKYFIQESDLSDDEFAYKVIKYLWDDAFKFNREEIFDKSTFPTLEKIINHFTKKQGKQRLEIFQQEQVVSRFIATDTE